MKPSEAVSTMADGNESDTELIEPRTGLKLTAIGLGVHWLGIVGLLAGLVLSLVTTGLEVSGQPGAETWRLAAGLVVLIALVPFALGPILTLAAPASAGRTFGFLAIGMYAAGFVIGVAGELDVVPTLMQFLSVLAILGGVGCYLVFMEKLAAFIDSDPLYNRAEFLLRTLVLIVILSVLSFVPILGCITGLIELVAYVVFAAAYLFLVGILARTIWHETN